VSVLHQQTLTRLQIIIINKIDLMSPKDVKSLSAFIRTFNTVAKIVETTRSRVPLADVVNSRSFSMQRAEKMKGWLARARGDVQPESEEWVTLIVRSQSCRYF
jgi:G3E family GTPase